MKKSLKAFAVVAVATLALTGCSSSVTTKVTNPDEVIVKINDKEIIKQDVYRTMVQQYGQNQVMNKFLTAILDANVKLDEKELKAANEELAKMKEQFGDNFAMMIQNYGYKDEKEYLNNVILLNKKNEKLMDQFIEEDYENLVKAFNPTKLKYMTITNEEAANKALELLKSDKEEEKDWKSVAEKFAAIPAETEEKFVLINDKYEGPAIVKTIVEGNHDLGLIDKTYLEGGQYYIFEITGNDPETLKEEIVAQFKNEENRQFTHLKMLEYYAEKMDFKIHDTDIFNQIKEISEDLAR